MKPPQRTEAERIAGTRPTGLRFAIRYADGSGIKLAVAYDEHDDPDNVIIEAVDELRVDTEQLDWLIGSLLAIRALLSQEQTDER